MPASEIASPYYIARYGDFSQAAFTASGGFPMKCPSPRSAEDFSVDDPACPGERIKGPSSLANSLDPCGGIGPANELLRLYLQLLTNPPIRDSRTLAPRVLSCIVTTHHASENSCHVHKSLLSLDRRCGYTVKELEGVMQQRVMQGTHFPEAVTRVSE